MAIPWPKTTAELFGSQNSGIADLFGWIWGNDVNRSNLFKLLLVSKLSLLVQISKITLCNRVVPKARKSLRIQIFEYRKETRMKFKFFRRSESIKAHLRLIWFATRSSACPPAVHSISWESQLGVKPVYGFIICRYYWSYQCPSISEKEPFWNSNASWTTFRTTFTFRKTEEFPFLSLIATLLRLLI